MKKVALITGAGTGIGRATAQAFASDGYSVVLAGRNNDDLDRAVTEIGSGTVIKCDVGNPVEVNSLFDQIENKFGRIDLLFNNAGVSTPKIPIEDISYDQLMSVVNTNIVGAFLCSQRAIRLMKSQQPQGGRIINAGSVASHSPRPDTSPYTISKNAITGLTRSIALEGRDFNIAASQIDLGLTDTELASFAKGTKMSTDQVAQTILYMANLPLATTILSMIMMPIDMPFVGRG